ncbi:MAG: FtsX-like permease family protein, partial [Clostridiales bacterium]|nr:FtsX-like permease family protein [Clostridiales bacterium]
VIPLSSGTAKPLSEILSVEEVTIVGVVRSPLYATAYVRGASGIGTGAVFAFMLLPPSTFTLEAYTDIYATINNPDALSRFDPGYRALTDPAKTALRDIGYIRAPLRYEEALDDLNEKRREVAEAEQDLADAEQNLLEAEQELRDRKAEYDEALIEFDEQILDGQRQLDEANAELENARIELENSARTLANNEKRLKQTRAELDKSTGELDLARQSLRDYTAEMEALKEGLVGVPEHSAEYAAGAAQLAELQAAVSLLTTQVNELQGQLDAGEAEWRTMSQALANARAELTRNQREYDLEYDLYQSNLALFEEEHSEGIQNLREAQDDLDKAEIELIEKQAEYEDELRRIQPELEDARSKIADGEKALREISDPEWQALDLNDNESFADYKENCNRIEAVSNVFPLIFFLVAVLISLTAMTRTVDDDRTQIGLLRGLGYLSYQIEMKYVAVAVAATLLGASLGIIIGFNTIPRIIANAYNILYLFPPPPVSYNASYILLVLALLLTCTVGPALFISRKSLRESAASLMQPKAPLPGRRIFLELIPAVWLYFNFLQKVTARNIFRYIKRMLMTVVGIAGCTALILSGLGLNESMGSLVSDQFDRVMVFDCLTVLNAAGEEQRQEALSLFEQNALSSLYLRRESITIEAGDLSVDVFLLCPSTPETMDQFFRLRDAKTREPLTLSGDGVALTSKAARLTNAQVGDLLHIRTHDNRDIFLPVAAIAENYVEHYLCLTPEAYERFFEQTVEFNTLYGHLEPDADHDALAQLLLAEGTTGIIFTDNIRDRFADSIGALSYIIAVLIISAAALAFTVLFSLSGINVEERRREIATIKMLGFYDPEVSRYVNRETLILSIIGAILGLLLGQVLMQFILTTAEVDLIALRREVSVWCYLLSFVLTIVFTLIVNWVMGFRLRKIDMVESLKSVE